MAVRTTVWDKPGEFPILRRGGNAVVDVVRRRAGTRGEVRRGHVRFFVHAERLGMVHSALTLGIRERFCPEVL